MARKRLRVASACLSAVLPVVVLCASSGQTQAQLVNPSFEDGAFANPGDPNFAVFPGATGTLILPGESILTAWDVALSPYDPDHSIGFLPGGLEWVNVDLGSIDGARWVDLNRGADLWQISQTFPTVPGQAYNFSYYAVGGDTFGGAVTEFKLIGSSDLVVADDVTSVLGGFHWELFSHPFTADSSSTTAVFTGKAAGLDPISGSFIDKLAVAAVPEPGSLTLLGSLVTVSLCRLVRKGWARSYGKWRRGHSSIGA